MSIGIIAANRRRSSGTPVFTSSGLLAYMTANQTITATGQAASFDAALYNNTGYGTGTSITVPSTGLYRLFFNQAMFSGANAFTIGVVKGSAAFNGTFRESSDGAGSRALNGCTAIVSATAGDAFALQYLTAPSGVPSFNESGSNDERSWLSVEPIEAGRKYAVAAPSADTTVNTSSLAAIAMPTEYDDTSNFHDTGTNTSRMTVPAGVTLVRLSGAFDCNFGSHGRMAATKNGGTTVATPGLPAQTGYVVGNTTPRGMSVFGAPVAVATSDYFQLLLMSPIGGSQARASGSTWFCIEEVPASYKRVLVTHSTGQALAAATWTEHAWDSETYDTDSMHSTVSNTGRLVVPAGATEARLIYNVNFPSSAINNHQTRGRKNGADFIGAPQTFETTDGRTAPKYHNGVSAWVPVVPGDYFTVEAWTQSAETTDVSSWACLECR